jgi:hypothetical protein
MTTLFDKITCDKCGDWYREDWHHTCVKKEPTMNDKDFRVAYEPIIDDILYVAENVYVLNNTQIDAAFAKIRENTVAQRNELRKKLLDFLDLTPEQKKLLNLLRLADTKVEKLLVSSEVMGETEMESEYSMLESAEWEAQEPEEFEYSAGSELSARKARVVWVEQPRSSKQVYRGNLARLAARLSESEAAQEFEAPGELETE